MFVYLFTEDKSHPRLASGKPELLIFLSSLLRVEITGVYHHIWPTVTLGMEPRASQMLGKHPTN